MSEHKATLRWENTGTDFLKGRYSREHRWTFDGGVSVAASPAPSAVPPPYSNPDCVDPEEAFVASVASCHLLTFLYLASRRGFLVEDYHDEAVGTMSKNDNGVPWISEIVLRPTIRYGEELSPTREQELELHHDAHEQCFIANSIKTAVRVESPEAVSSARRSVTAAFLNQRCRAAFR